MKNYERPIVMINEDLAEGVYAASGLPTGPKGVSDCWSFEVISTNNYADGHMVFEVRLWHSTGLEHLSDATKVSVTFTSPLIDAYSQFPAEDSFDGASTLTITRTDLADSYNSGDTVSYKIWAQASDEATTKALEIYNVSVWCDKSINVQGGGGSEISPNS